MDLNQLDINLVQLVVLVAEDEEVGLKLEELHLRPDKVMLEEQLQI